MKKHYLNKMKREIYIIVSKNKTSNFVTFDEELEALFSLKPQLDSFLKKFFVNHEDEKIKTNRKNLIAQVYLGFRKGSVESSEYKHIVLGLIFLKFVSDTFEERREKLLSEGKEAFIDMVEFYTMENVFYLPEISRWSYIKQNAKQDDIALKIDTALATIEKTILA